MATSACTSCQSRNPYALYVREQQQALHQQTLAIQQSQNVERARQEDAEFQLDPSKTVDIVA